MIQLYVSVDQINSARSKIGFTEAVTQDFSSLSQIWMDKVDGNNMMTNPYPHPQHMKCVKHLSYVWSGGGNHSTWVWSLKHCTRAALVPSSDPGFQLTFPNLDVQEGW